MDIYPVFDLWNRKKQETHERKSTPYFLVGQIWWIQFGQNIATEINGKGEDFLRPAVIVQKIYGDACLVVPLTSQEKQGKYFYNFIDSQGNTQCAKLVQIRYLDAKRLKYKLSSVSENELKCLQEKLCEIIKNNPDR